MPTDWKSQMCLWAHKPFRFEMGVRKFNTEYRLVVWHGSCWTWGGFSPAIRSCRISVPLHLLPHGLRVSQKEVLFVKYKSCSQVNNSGLVLKTCFSACRCIFHTQHADCTAVQELMGNGFSRQPSAIKYTWNLHGNCHRCWKHSPAVSGMSNNAQVK